MAQQGHDPVIGSQFIVSHKMKITVYRCPSGDLEITDSKKNMMFTIRSCDSTLHSQRLMREEHGTPIAKLRAKNRTAHDRWNAFKGESIAANDMIFSAARNNMIQNQTHVILSLANEIGRSDACDFQIKGSWSNRNCTINKGDTSTVIAQMHPGKSPERFKVTINPNVDYAFVVALIAIVDAMKSPGTMKVAGHVAAKVAKEVVSVGVGVAVTTCIGGLTLI